jgi:murein DD-endopeptidase MepM/ murein hydrolase activator NlpD
VIRRARVAAVCLALVGAAVISAAPQANAEGVAPARTFRFPLPTWHQSGYGFGDRTPVGACPGVPARHTGFDAVARAGETVVAAANGMIMEIRQDPVWGKAVIIEHLVPDEGLVTTQYWHVVPRRGFGPGTVVTKGEPIATVADLGSRTHLHFGVYKAEYDINAGYGGLPVRFCNFRSAFPSHFVDPVAYVLRHEAQASGLSTGTRVVAGHSAGTERTELLVACPDVCHRVVAEAPSGSV